MNGVYLQLFFYKLLKTNVYEKPYHFSEKMSGAFAVHINSLEKLFSRKIVKKLVQFLTYTSFHKIVL